MSDYPEHVDGTVYEVSLNRWFNILKFKIKSQYTAIFVLLELICIYFALIKDEFEYYFLTVLIPLYIVLMLFCKIIAYPSHIDVTSEYIIIKYDNSAFNFFGHLMRNGKADIKKDNEDYYITKIEYIHFEQSSFEKKFDSGHFTICGTSYLSDAPVNQSGENKTFTVYGLKKYNETKAWLEEHVNTMEKSRKEELH